MLSITAAVLNTVYDALLLCLLKILILLKLIKYSHLFISFLGIAFIKYSAAADSFQRFYREKCYRRDSGKFQNLWYVHVLLSAYW